MIAYLRSHATTVHSCMKSQVDINFGAIRIKVDNIIKIYMFILVTMVNITIVHKTLNIKILLPIKIVSLSQKVKNILYKKLIIIISQTLIYERKNYWYS